MNCQTVSEWLAQQGIEPGPPLIRYLVIDMDKELEIDVGLPIERAIPGNGRISAETLPAGHYATAIYRGTTPAS
jgi:effector-binding domain-containing protein